MVEIIDERGTHFITYKSWKSYSKALQYEIQLLQQLSNPDRVSKCFLGVVKCIQNGKLKGNVKGEIIK